MKKPTMKKFALCLFVAALLPLNVVSQTPQDSVEKSTNEGQFTLKTSTEVVLVNVTVRDKSDNFIKDLTAKDFTILEDGKKQDVISVDFENTDSVVTAEAPKTTDLLANLGTAPAKAGAAATPPAPVDVNALKDRRLIVLFFDLSSMQPEEIERASKSGMD